MVGEADEAERSLGERKVSRQGAAQAAAPALPARHGGSGLAAWAHVYADRRAGVAV